jgi:cell division protein FtsA
MPDRREPSIAGGGNGGGGSLIAALDIGTAQICCFIAEDDGDGVLRVLGVGHKVSRGLKNGAVVDMDAAEAAIREAVHAAESMAGETIRTVAINLSAGRPHSQRFAVEVSLGGHEVGEPDIKQVLDEGYRLPVPDDRTAVHLRAVNYSMDGIGGIRDPRGLFGDQLGVIMHMVTVARGAVRNLTACVGRCHLEIEDLVLSSYASGRAVLVDDELSLGAVCIDLGAGASAIGAFSQGELVFADSVPVGGAHITNDIAYCLSTAPSDAERLKTLHGSAIVGGTDERQMIDVPEVGESPNAGPNHVSRAKLIEIIKPRVEETFEMVRDRIAAAGLDEMSGRRVVLTGGASQLSGIREVAAQILDCPVRIGKPQPIRGLAASTSGPAFATCAGLLAHVADREARPVARRPMTARDPMPGFVRIGQWLRENF